MVKNMKEFILSQFGMKLRVWDNENFQKQAWMTEIVVDDMILISEWFNYETWCMIMERKFSLFIMSLSVNSV